MLPLFELQCSIRAKWFNKKALALQAEKRQRTAFVRFILSPLMVISTVGGER
jgi:hypothetical protein